VIRCSKSLGIADSLVLSKQLDTLSGPAEYETSIEDILSKTTLSMKGNKNLLLACGI